MEKITRELAREQNNLLLLAGKNLEGRMLFRIFNKGKNSDEKPIGKYKDKWWMGVRRSGKPPKFPKSGRQIGYVDLEYTGELRGSIHVVKDGPTVALAIIDKVNYDKAMGQQLIQGRKAGKAEMIIFEPSKKEVTAVQNYVNDLVEEQIEKTIQLFT